MRCLPNRHAQCSMFRLLTTCFVILALASCASSVMAQGVQYRLTWLESPAWANNASAYDINESGTIAGAVGNSDTGYSLAVMWVGGIAVDLNTLGTLTYLEDGLPATNWIATVATNVNEYNQIVGVASNLDAPDEERPFIFDLNSMSFDLLPGVPGLTGVGWPDINDDGVVAAILVGSFDGDTYVYKPWSDPEYKPEPTFFGSGSRINNNGIITHGGAGREILIPGPDYDYSLGGARVDLYYENLRIYGIQENPDYNTNHTVTVCGSYLGSGKGKDKSPRGPMTLTYHPDTQAEPEVILPGEFGWARDVNLRGDTVIQAPNVGGLLDTVFTGVVALDDLIVNKGQDWQPGVLNPAAITDSNDDTDPHDIGFGQICGWGTGRAFLLSPEPFGYVPPAPPGISVTPSNGLVTTESGGQDALDVVLDSEPTADVTIGISSSNTAEGTVDVASLTFTSANWDTAQTVTITGVDDLFEDGDQSFSIVTAAATSSDPEYNGLDAGDVSVTNEDDDSSPDGGTEMYFSTDTPTNIPDRDMADSAIVVNDDFQIVDMAVTLNISHPRPSDLTAYLVGPNSDFIQLSNLTGDNAVSDFNGISTDGTWTLEVHDSRNKKTGTINGWSMTVDY